MVGMTTNLFSLALNPSKKMSSWKLGLCAGFLIGAASSGCGLGIPITLQTQTFMQNFGNSSGTVQSVPCTQQQDPCTQAAQQVSTALASDGATVTGICNTQAQQCTAQIDATVSYPVNLSMDQSFTSSVAGRAVSIVQSISLLYGVPTNTTTFPIPELDLYIAPAGVTSVTDSRAVYIDKVPSIAKAQTLPSNAGSITVQTNSPAGTQFVHYIQNPTTPFVILINAKPVLSAGEPLPAGEIVVNVTPQITVGF
jgi:hypothetical protein